MSASRPSSNPYYIRTSTAATAAQTVWQFVQSALPPDDPNRHLIESRARWLGASVTKPHQITVRTIAKLRANAFKNDSLDDLAREALQLVCEATATRAQVLAVECGVLALSHHLQPEEKAGTFLSALLPIVLEEEQVFLRATEGVMPMLPIEVSDDPTDVSFAPLLRELALELYGPESPPPRSWTRLTLMIEGFNSAGLFAANALLNVVQRGEAILGQSLKWLTSESVQQPELGQFLSTSGSGLALLCSMFTSAPGRGPASAILAHEFRRIGLPHLAAPYENWER